MLPKENPYHLCQVAETLESTNKTYLDSKHKQIESTKDSAFQLRHKIYKRFVKVGASHMVHGWNKINNNSQITDIKYFISPNHKKGTCSFVLLLHKGGKGKKECSKKAKSRREERLPTEGRCIVGEFS